MSEEICYSYLYLWWPAATAAATMDKLQTYIDEAHPEARELFGSPTLSAPALAPWPEQGVVEMLPACYPTSQMPKHLIGSLLDLAAEGAGVVVVLLEWSDAEEALGTSARFGFQNGETLVASKALLEGALDMDWTAALKTVVPTGNGAMADKLLEVALTHCALLRVTAPFYAQARAAHLEKTLLAAPAPKVSRF